MTDPDDSTVTYTVKELLEHIKKDQTVGFTEIKESMAGKADKADVARLETTLSHHAEQLGRHREQIGELEKWKRDEIVAEKTRQKTRAWWRSAWAVVSVAIGSVSVIIAALIGIHAF